jgi:hypothetical protein
VAVRGIRRFADILTVLIENQSEGKAFGFFYWGLRPAKTEPEDTLAQEYDYLSDI